MKYIASCSFGKDSLATLLLAMEHGEPLDEAVYCEVMFDKTISGEVPEHRDFIYNTAIPRLEEMGIRVKVLRSEKTYVDLFAGKVTRGPKKGMLRSFPICGKCAVQRDCKIRPIRQYQKSLPADTVQYIGIAQDEQERLLRLTGQQVSLLEKYHFTEEDAKFLNSFSIHLFLGYLKELLQKEPSEKLSKSYHDDFMATLVKIMDYFRLK